MKVWANASEPQYVDHLAPIWRSLNPDRRGRFICSTPAALAEAIRLDLDPYGKLVRRVRRSLADPDDRWLVAAYGDLRHLAPARCILVEHGAGQHYGGDGGQPTAGQSPYYSGGIHRDSVDLFVCPNQLVADRNAAQYPTARHVLATPRLDDLAAIRASRDENMSDRLTVAVSFHWPCTLIPEARWAWPHWRAAVEELATTPDINLIGHGHPRAWPHLSRWWATLGVERFERFDDVIARADVFVCDNSSAMFEAAAVGIPVVVLDAPWYRRTVNHGLRFWEWADIGPRIGDGTSSALSGAVSAATDSQWGQVRDAMTRAVYGGPPNGTSGAAVAAAIEEAAS